jgi:predicted ABC-type ATPase
MPKLRVFAGPNGSGKSTLHDDLVRERSFHPLSFVNADVIQRDLNDGRAILREHLESDKAFMEFCAGLRRSTFKGAAEAAALLSWTTGGVRLRSGARCGGYLAAAIADVLRNRLLDVGLSFSFETVMSDRRKLAFLRSAREQDYRIYLYFVSTGDVEANVARVRQRVQEGGHAVQELKVRQRFMRCMALLREAILLSDRAYLFDSAGPSRHVATYDGSTRVLSFTTEETPAWVADLRTPEGD